MKKVLFIAAIVAGTISLSSCVSKKELVKCQNENKELTTQYQNSRESLAAANARISSLLDQLSACKNNNEALQASLSQSLSTSLAMFTLFAPDVDNDCERLACRASLLFLQAFS